MADSGRTQAIDSYPCTICGCTCDDIRLTIENDRVIAAENACSLGVAGLTTTTAEEDPPAWIEGKPASLEAAIERAAEILRASRFPLVYGCTDSTVESQRLAVQITQRIRGVLDSQAFAATPVFHDIGSVTCSLGEAKNRADLIVMWSCDPATTHPRLLSRYLLDPQGRFRPIGRRNRTLIVVGDPKRATNLGAHECFANAPGRDFEDLWLLRAIVQGKPVEIAAENGKWLELADRLRKCQFGVLVVDESIGARSIEAAYGLATDLQAVNRFYVLVLRAGANSVGMQNVATWLTGCPGPVSFHGSDVAWGDDFCANRLLGRGLTDAALLIGRDSLRGLSPESMTALRGIPQIILSPQPTLSVQPATVAIRIAPFPHSCAGTVFRMDGISLPLPLAIPASVPDDYAVLSRLATRLVSA